MLALHLHLGVFFTNNVLLLDESFQVRCLRTTVSSNETLEFFKYPVENNLAIRAKETSCKISSLISAPNLSYETLYIRATDYSIYIYWAHEELGPNLRLRSGERGRERESERTEREESRRRERKRVGGKIAARLGRV